MVNHGSKVLLEPPQRLSHSRLWRLQRNFFEQQGVAAWSRGIVPQYITSNPMIARTYAQIVFAWLRDCAAALDESQPVYLVELGAGSGRLGYHFLRAFFPLLDQSVLKRVPVVYVLTDYSERTVESWQAHPQLAPFAAAGRLDFARFDGERDDRLELRRSGMTLAAGTVRNPLGLIANYFFDGLTQDAFRIEDGELFESRIRLTVAQPEFDPDDPELLRRVEVGYEMHGLPVPYYDDPDFEQILRAYPALLPQTNLLFPIGALRCLRTLQALSSGRFLLLSGDKGYHHVEDLAFRELPDFSFHGSISMMVNYHALGQFVQAQGGTFLSTPYRPTGLDIGAFLLDERAGDYSETRQAYRLGVAQSGPDDFYALKKGVEKYYRNWELPQLLAYLRLSGWDSDLFLDCFPALLGRVERATGELREELEAAVERIWEAYFHLGEERDLPFALGELLYALRRYPRAIEFFEHSLRLYGEDAETRRNIEQCRAAMGASASNDGPLFLSTESRPL